MMKLRMYVHTWQGVDLTTLQSVKDLPPDQIAGPPVYEEFYRILNDTQESADRAWLEGKIQNGQVLLERVIRPWEQREQRRPAILSIGAGRGITEEVWLQEGYNVTLQEVQPFSFREISRKYPTAKFVVGDVRTLLPQQERYDIIFMLGLDYLMHDEELVDLFRISSTLLKERGFLVNHTMNSLSVRQLLVYFLRRFMGTHKRGVLWGYYRTPAELNKTARQVGLRISAQYCYPRYVWSRREKHIIAKERPRFFYNMPTLASSNVITVYEKASTSS